MPRVLVGRDQELTTLLARVDDARRGRPGLVICLGESGIGKTRLARALESRLCSADVLTLWGTAAGSGATWPLWHWREVVAALARVGVDDAHAVLARLDRGDAEASLPSRARLFDSVIQLLARAAAASPVVVVLDDFHDADQASHLLLRQLVQVVRSERLLLVAAARALDGHLGPLVREPGVTTIELGPLSDQDIAAHFHGATGRDPLRAELAVLARATAGNPFLLEELVGPVAAGEQVLAVVPPSVADFVERRVAALPPAVRSCLAAGAVLGLDFSSATVGELTRDDARSACGAAVREGLLRAGEEPGRFVFVHSIVRDAILDRLDAADRAVLHRAAAQALEQQNVGGSLIFDIAEHWRHADVPSDLAGRACEAIAAAGRAAVRRHAYEDGRRLFAGALSVGGAAVGDRLRADLLLGRAFAESLTADLAAALQTCRQVIELAGMPELTDVAVDSALVCEPTFDPTIDAQVRAICESVLARPHLSDADRARVLSRYALVCDNLCDLDTAEQAGDAALSCADRAGDAAALAMALDANRLVRSGPDHLGTRARAAQRMRRLGEATRDTETRLAAAEWHLDIAAELGDLSGAAAELRAVAQCASELGGPVARWRVLRCQAMLAQARGRLADAWRYGRLARETVAPIGFPQGEMLWRGLVTNLGHHSGYDADSLVLLELADDARERDWPLAGVVLTLSPAWVLTQLGRLGEARTIYRRLGPVRDWPETPHARLFTWALGIATAAALGADDDVVVLRDRLADHRGHHVVNGRHAMAYLGPAELWLGVAAAHLGLVEDAVVDLEHAAKACAASGADGFRAEAEAELAAVLLRRSGPGDLPRARSLAAGAARTASMIGAVPLEERARSVLDTVDCHPSLRLTPREVEVVRLVGDGLTNREIAQRLFLSQRTAQNHVQHILDKLDLRRRDQIAAWWRRAEMSTPAE